MKEILTQLSEVIQKVSACRTDRDCKLTLFRLSSGYGLLDNALTSLIHAKNCLKQAQDRLRLKED